MTVNIHIGCKKRKRKKKNGLGIPSADPESPEAISTGQEDNDIPGREDSAFECRVPRYVAMVITKSV